MALATADLDQRDKEAELLQRIDQGIADADAGVFVDSEIFEHELEEEFGLA